MVQEYLIVAEARRGTAVGYLSLQPDGSQCFAGMAENGTRFGLGDGWLHIHRLRSNGSGAYAYNLQPVP